MLRRMSSRELTQWQIFEATNPFPVRSGMYGAGVVAATFSNLNSKKRYKPEDFIPTFERPKEQTVDGMIGWVAQMNAAFGGQDLRNKNKDG